MPKGFYTRRPRPTEPRFWDKVDKNGPIHPYDPELGNCWIWTAARNEEGKYGVFYLNGRLVTAHRAAYQMATGETLTSEDLVCHSCDNPPCVRSDHLHKGDLLSNVQETISRGRNRWGAHPGAENGRAKLSVEQVSAIREQYDRGGISQSYLAKAFGVEQTTISSIIRRKLWAHYA